jgi:hypothetical protein
MGLMDRLREAEEQGREAARHAYERARELGEDAQRRLRQKMRIYPPHLAQTQSPSEVSQAQPAATVPPTSEIDDVRHLEAEPRQPIVSIKGEDVEEKDKPQPASSEPERKIA